jgi:hypothetical protein
MAVEIKLPVDIWYDIVNVLRSVAADQDDEELDKYADDIHVQLEKWEKRKSMTKWRSH